MAEGWSQMRFFVGQYIKFNRRSVLFNVLELVISLVNNAKKKCINVAINWFN